MPDAPDNLMLFAAGLGTRMGSLTAQRPKPLIEVAGRALIDHALALAAEASVRHTVVNTHYRGDQIADHLLGRRGITLSHEPELLETGGGLKAALPLLGGDAVLTLNSDAVWAGPNPLNALRAAWDPARMDVLVLLVSPTLAHGHVGKGDFLVDSRGRISRGRGEIYAGAQIVKTEPVSSCPERIFSMNRVFDSLIAAGRAFGLRYEGAWCDVGRPEGIPLAEAMLAKERADVRG